jgi:4-hydroxy-tetrahydrodipicolinate synthase
VTSTPQEQQHVVELIGILSAMSTAFTPDGEQIDEAGMRDLVEHTVGAGVHGLVPAGSTGEFAAMTGEERRRLLEVVLDQTAGRVPVVPGIGAMTTREAVSLAKHAEAAGAAGVLAVAPYYEPLDLHETKRYFRDVADSISIPVVIYNLPVATGVNLAPDDIRELAVTCENIGYVKDTTGDLTQATRLIKHHADVVKTFVGWDTLLLSSLVEGAPGSIVGAANVNAAQLVAMYDAVQEGRLDDARQIWEREYPLMDFLVSGGYVGAVKGALDLVGRSAGPARQPIAPLPDGRRDELAQILARAAQG